MKKQVMILVFLISLAICVLASMPVKAQANGSFVFNPVTSPQTAGTPFTITITNQVAAGFNGVATLTVSVGTITPTSTTAFTSGVWTGQVTVTGAGSGVTITATSGTTIGTSAPFTVNPGALDHFDIVVPASETAGSSFGGVKVTAYDADNNVKTDYTGSVYFMSADPHPATLPYSSTSKYTFVGGDNGAHTFSGFTLFTTPSQTITVTDGSISNVSTPITVNAAAPDHFVVSAPSSAVAGSDFTLSVTAKDAYGNTITSYSTSVGLTATTGTLTPSSTGTSGWASGVWSSSSVTLSVVGSITITAQSGTAIGTATLTVTAGPATHLVVSGFPNPATAGVAGSVTVTAKDADGNTATGYSGMVEITSSDGQAVLPANAGLSSGIGSFTVTLKTAATESITATDTVSGTITGSQTGITVNPGSASTLAVSGFPSPAIAGAPGSVTVTAKDAYGNTATGYVGTVKITSSDGKAVLPANYAFKASDAGIHSFSVTLKTSGSQSITATDTVTKSITGSQTGITVNVASGDYFVVTGFPSPTVAGAAHTVSVTVVDPYGNTVTGYSGTVKITSSDTQAVLPANSVLSSGTGSFSVTLETAGSQSITATDTVTSSINGSQTAITVNPAATSTLAVSGFPSPTVAGAAHTITVTALDAYNNTATGYAGTVKITSSDGKAVLPANAALTNGVGSFSVTLATVGSQSITATDTVTASITGSQSGITVSAGGLDHFVFDTVDAQTTGVAFTITVTAKDASNNTVTSYVGTPSLTYSAGTINPTTMSAFVGGVGSTSVTVAAAGSGVTITAADGSMIGTSNTFTVTLAPTTPPTPTPTPTPKPKSGTTPTPTPTPHPPPSPNIVLATNSTGGIVMLGLNGTLTSYQVSNAMIVLYAPDKTVTVSFTINGSNGTEVFGNMTIPKAALYAGESPVVYIDGLQSSLQNYTQDANNFYVWFTTTLSLHHVAIQFVVTMTSTAISSEPLFIVGVTIPEIVAVFSVIAVRRIRRGPDEA